MVISGRRRGVDARTHNLPLTGIYKEIFAHVLAYACFYKSENFCAYVHFYVYCCSLDGLIASIVLLICTSLWIKASAK